MKVRKDDEVAVLTGREKGKTGKIVKVFPDDETVLVQGLNMVKRHTRPTQGRPGGIVEKEAPIHVSNVALIDPKDRKPTKVGSCCCALGLRAVNSRCRSSTPTRSGLGSNTKSRPI